MHRVVEPKIIINSNKAEAFHKARRNLKDEFYLSVLRSADEQTTAPSKRFRRGKKRKANDNDVVKEKKPPSASELKRNAQRAYIRKSIVKMLEDLGIETQDKIRTEAFDSSNYWKEKSVSFHGWPADAQGLNEHVTAYVKDSLDKVQNGLASGFITASRPGFADARPPLPGSEFMPNAHKRIFSGWSVVSFAHGNVIVPLLCPLTIHMTLHGRKSIVYYMCKVTLRKSEMRGGSVSNKPCLDPTVMLAMVTLKWNGTTQATEF
ncbi:hypothetical protein MBANPS3_011936 [Mucor bainieri]